MQQFARYLTSANHAERKQSAGNLPLLLLTPILIGVIVLIVIQHLPTELTSQMLSSGSCAIGAYAAADLPPVALCP
jgi:hypothetical protein